MTQQEAVEFIPRAGKYLFADCDIEKMSAAFAEDATLMIDGNESICRGRASVIAVMEKWGQLCSGPIHPLFLDYQASPLEKNSGWLVTGRVKLSFGDDRVLDIFMTGIITGGERPLIRHLHISSASVPEQEKIIYDPLTAAERAVLRRRVDEQSRDLQAITENIPGGVIRCCMDESFHFLYVSDGFLNMIRYTRRELYSIFDNSYLNIIYPDDRTAMIESMKKQLETGVDWSLEYRIVRRGGEIIWVIERGQIVVSENGERSFYSILIDDTQEKAAKEDLRLSLERHKIIMDQTTDIIFEWDIVNDRMTYSANWEKKFGYSPIKEHFLSTIAEKSRIHPDDMGPFVCFMQEIRAGKSYSEGDLRISDTNNLTRWFRVRMTAQFDQNNVPVKAVGVIVDIDREKRAAELLMEKASRDALTGVYNKMAAQSRVESILLEHSGSRNALMMIDIDDFGRLNNSKGHLFGDAVLSDACDKIGRLFRSGDVIGRVGGDEFIVFLRDIPSEDYAAERAEKILDVFRGLLDEQSGQGRVTCSIGIAVSPENGADFRSLFRNADFAAYEAKKRGKDRAVLYRDSMNQRSVYNTDYIGEDLSEASEQENNQQLFAYVCSTLSHSGDIDLAIRHLLSVIGRQYDVSRMYIFEDSPDGAYTTNTFEWCEKGVSHESSNMQHLDFEEFGGLYQYYNDDGIFYCRDIQSLPDPQRSVLEKQNIKSLLQCAMFDRGRICGFIGFDDCRAKRYWTKDQINTLVLIAGVIGTFLLRRRLEREEPCTRSLCDECRQKSQRDSHCLK